MGLAEKLKAFYESRKKMLSFDESMKRLSGYESIEELLKQDPFHYEELVQRVINNRIEFGHSDTAKRALLEHKFPEEFSNWKKSLAWWPSALFCTFLTLGLFRGDYPFWFSLPSTPLMAYLYYKDIRYKSLRRYIRKSQKKKLKALPESAGTTAVRVPVMSEVSDENPAKSNHPNGSRETRA